MLLPDPFGIRRRSLPDLLTAISTALSLPHVAQLHQHLLSRGLLSSPFLATKLLQLYADAGDLAAALRLFAALPCAPSVFAWTSLLALLARSHLHRRCLATYSLMRSSSPSASPDGYVFPPVLRSAAAASLLPAVSAVHADAVKFSAAAALPVANALIAAYGRCGDVAPPRRTFDLTTDRDLLSWNSIIAAYAAVGAADAALDLARSMRSDGCEPDLVTWNTVMDGCCRAGRCDEAAAVLDQLPRPNVVSWTTVISGYARGANQEAALRLFRGMVADGRVPPDHHILSGVASSCRHVAAFYNGLEVHAYGLKTMDVNQFYGAAGAALVTMYAVWGRTSHAEAVVRSMDPTDVVTWNAMIHGFGRSGLGREALDYFTEMRSRGIGFNMTTLATILPVCNLDLGRQIHGYVTRHGHGSNTIVWNALISMYSQSGSIRTAHRVFSSMPLKDIVSWNAMMGAYASHGLGQDVLELVRLMSWCGPRPDAQTFTNVLVGCSHGGLVDEGLRIFDMLVRDAGLSPTMEQYACIVDLLGRAGRFEEAVEYISKMPVTANASVWGALLASSRLHQNVEFGRMAFDQLVVLEPENSGNFVTMSNIYTRAGMFKEAKMVRRVIDRKELAKPSGYSWVAAA